MSQSELRGLESGSRAPPWEMGCNSGLGGRRLASFPDWPRHFSPVSESRRGQDHCQSWRTRSNLCWGWSPGEALSTPYSHPSARQQPTHPILAEVVSLHAGPLRQKRPSPQPVPSAQGKWRVWHTIWPLALPVHHSLVQDCM